MPDTAVRAHTKPDAFLSDVTTLRERARKSLDNGAVTPTYEGDKDKAIELLQNVLATEIVCVLRYTMHSISVEGLSSQSVAEEFAEHAKDERQHVMAAAERIDQLGGIPNFNPEGLASRSATEYGQPGTLVEMVKQDLIAERIAIDHYRELIRYFGDKDPTTRIMLEGFLADEEDHATDMHDLLVSHEGRPFLD
ncbi:bacterioferritin [Ameyamaea chiangmaiensis NBRC 103196]|uniref:Ferritin-like domain-containing protein n=1 Tax=Ameyamaea chiangmaiensis TaxID=442969 RepID=A0A850PA20_9PROT|nr:ferritin-like domain-containing protein [Ameyamaea chiangmaiensis]MBS4074223.1 ferritin-like domain-containing protein [Ameyamaea chiangmaiensis]NVN39166.1 ferritin-like domain-containing protein [Ameyamaea chiangmaiensis]GBQ71298.1 bacterioferritin [Ameyamaea chiangmaiensis NBRC 103196]